MKKLNPIELKKIQSTAQADNWYVKLYIKDDGNLYIQDENWNEKMLAVNGELVDLNTKKYMWLMSLNN